MFGTDIEQIVILMVDRDMVFEEFIVKPVEFKHLTRKWKNRLIQFNKYNT
jgi:predicted GIY-YIG superfamily endonuclease